MCGAANIRYWLSAGRGGFALSPSECARTSFYVMVYTTETVSPIRHLEGFKVTRVASERDCPCSTTHVRCSDVFGMVNILCHPHSLFFPHMIYQV